MTTDQTHSDHTYIVNEIVGSSPEGVDQAIRNGLARAAKTLRHLDWSEVRDRYLPLLERISTRRELSDLLVRSIGELPESYRNVLLLRDIEELDTDETAEAMGISPGAVKTRLHRARQALRGLLAPHLEEAVT